MEVIRSIFHTRPNKEELEACKLALAKQSKQTINSLKKVDKALKRNEDITYNIGRAVGAIK